MGELKVFCIGFQKTGTTSLGLALHYLGYKVCGYNPFRGFSGKSDFDLKLFEKLVYELSEQYSAFKDTPWPLFYKEMDEKYPGSKFILVVRDTDKWFLSALKDFKNTENAIHHYIYGVSYPEGNEEIFKKRYEKHNNDVIKYFKNRPGDFLCLNLEAGEVNWENICKFLGKDIPNKQWPHANTAQRKKIKTFFRRLKDFIVRVYSK